MTIAGKEYSEIIIKTTSGELLASLTDENVITEEGVDVAMIEKSEGEE